MTYDQLPLATWFHDLRRAREMRATVRRLSRLNDHTLRDIGLWRGDLEAGVRRKLGDR